MQFIRQQPRPHFKSTLEAVAETLRALDSGPAGQGAEAAAVLLSAFAAMDRLQRRFYTEQKAKGQGVAVGRALKLAAVATVDAAQPTLLEPMSLVRRSEAEAAGKKQPLLERYVLCQETVEGGTHQRSVRAVGAAVATTFDDARRQCASANALLKLPRGCRLTVLPARCVNSGGSS